MIDASKDGQNNAAIEETAEVDSVLEDLRKECRDLEVQLGINSFAERMIEATLCIDSPLLKLALLKKEAHPEETFGAEFWRNWLLARLESKKSISEDETLSVELIIRLASLLQHGKPEGAVLRNYQMEGGDFKNPKRPAIFQPLEIGGIYQSDLLTFKTVNWGPPVEGFIVYPTLRSEESKKKLESKLTQAQKLDLAYSNDDMQLMQFLLENAAVNVHERLSKLDEVENSAESVAGDFAREVVSVHPFEDRNGTLSRLLLNHVLEMAGQSETSLDNFNDDLFLNPLDWNRKIKNGVLLHTELLGQAEKIDRVGNPDLTIFAFFSPQELAFFEKIMEATHPLANVDLQDISGSFAFMKEAEARFQQFKQITQAGVKLRGVDAHAEIGGIVPSEFTSNWGTSLPQEQQERRAAFYDEEVHLFRGAVVEDGMLPEELLLFFQRPVALNTSSRYLYEENYNPLSAQPVDVSVLRREFNDLNGLVVHDANAYITRFKQGVEPFPSSLVRHNIRRYEDTFEDFHASEEQKLQGRNALENGRFLSWILREHSRGMAALWEASQVVSASTSTTVAEDFAIFKSTNTSIATATKDIADKGSGVLFDFSLPKTGILSALDTKLIPITAYFNSGVVSEREYYIEGGIEPAAINLVRLYSRETKLVEAVAFRRANNPQELCLVNYLSHKAQVYVFQDEGSLTLQLEVDVNEDLIQELNNFGIY